MYIQHVFTVNNRSIDNVKSYKYLGITISSKNCSLNKTLNNLTVKANRALFSLKTNLNLLKMPIKLLLKIFDTMIEPILLYGAEIWVPAGKYTCDKWDKTEIEQQHTWLLKQTLGLNRSVPNNMVRAKFVRMPLIMNAHARVWNYIKYLKKKVEKPLVQKSYEIDSDPEVRDSLFRECDNRYRDIIAKNINKSHDP